tara:strand:- start:165 stop:461 length:297 start_codon:yes stop_codon:yes gene_type:complete
MVHTVVATFKFKTQDDQDRFKKVLASPEGLTKTRGFEGNVSIQCFEAEENIMVIWQQWDSKDHHTAYLKYRSDEGLLGKIKESLREDLEIVHLSNVRV